MNNICILILVSLSIASASSTWAEPLSLKPELTGRHPRLFFTEEDVPAIRARCEGPHEDFYNRLMSGAGSYVKMMPPAKASDCANDQSMQQWAWWRLGTLAFAYVATGEDSYGDRAKDWVLTFCDYEDWGAGQSRNQSMGVGNMLSGVALAYDLCYDRFTSEEQAIVKAKLNRQIREMIYSGFEDPTTDGYWKQDYQNNHRHHRLCGILLASLAIYDEVPEAAKYAEYAAADCRKVLNSLPSDGSSHESPGYMAFGYSYVIRAFSALKHCTGIDLFDHPGIRNMPYFRAHMLTPGFKGVFNYGDGGGGAYYFNHYLWKCAAIHRDGVAQALMKRAYDAAPGSFSYYGWDLLFHDPTLEPSSLDDLPTWRYFPDLEVATYRSSWDDPNALGVFFKCSPYGGHRLNEVMAEEGRGWVNVAHDHPDANHFMIFANGQMWATDNGKKKLAASHNVLMVDGKGQAHRGSGWSQPIPGMADMGRIDAFFGTSGWFAVRGDASEYFEALDKWRRCLVVVDDAYVVICDEVKNTEARLYEWLYHCDGDWEQLSPNHLLIRKGEQTFTISPHTIWPGLPDGMKVKLSPDTIEGRDRGTLLTVTPAGPGTNASFLVVLQPGSDPLPAKAEDGEGNVHLEITRGDQVDNLLFNWDGNKITWHTVHTDAFLAITTEEDGVLCKAMMVNGTHLRMGDFSISSDEPVNLRWDGKDKALWISAPVGMPEGMRKIRVNDEEHVIKVTSDTIRWVP